MRAITIIHQHLGGALLNNVVHIYDLALVYLVDRRVIHGQTALREHLRVTSQRVELVWRQNRAS